VGIDELPDNPHAMVLLNRSAATQEIVVAGTRPNLLSAQEACRVLRCSKSHFYKVLIPRYLRHCIKHGRKAFFDRREIEELSLNGWK